MTIRLIPLKTLSGPANMAADEVMLAAAERGTATLRFYEWSEPTLSLGYFQNAAERLNDPLLRDLAWVRRPSGGGAILHHYELTYCLAVPAGTPWHTRESWICRFHHLIATSLLSFGVDARPVVCGNEKNLGDFLCFQHQTPADLLIGGSKIAGSAQRKRHGAIMQHGSILLRQSEFTPALPGIGEQAGKEITPMELSESLVEVLQQATGWQVDEATFTDDESREIEMIVREKYGSTEWNEKR